MPKLSQIKYHKAIRLLRNFSVLDVARFFHLNVHTTTIQRLKTLFNTSGSVADRARKITGAEDRHIRTSDLQLDAIALNLQHKQLGLRLVMQA